MTELGGSFEGGKPLPVAQGFGDVEAHDLVAAIKIGQGAGDAQDAMIAARGEIHGIGCLTQKLQTRAVRSSKTLEEFAIDLGVGADVRQVFVALRLPLASSGNTGGDVEAFFLWRGEREIGGFDGRQFDLDIETVKERA